MKIERKEKFGGDREYITYEELQRDFVNKKLHPLDLKNSTINNLIEIFKNTRTFFDSNQDMLKELGGEFLP